MNNRSPPKWRRANDRVPHRQHRAADVRGAGDRVADGLPGGIRTGGGGPGFRRARYTAWPVATLAAASAAGTHLGRDVERHAAGGAVFYLHGADSGAQRHGRRPARYHRPVVRRGARRAGVCGDFCRRAAGRDHRRGGGIGDLHGPDLIADHAALRLRPAAGLRRDCGVGHAGADYSAVAGVDYHGRSTGPLGGRHVCGCICAWPPAGGVLCGVRAGDHYRQAAVGAGVTA